MEGYRGENVEVFSALPVGRYRRHLAWLEQSFVRYDAVLDALDARAASSIAFARHPKAFLFYRTRTPRYPSAYALDGVIGYNVEGPLYVSERDVRETIFHELFHVNDQLRDGWAERALTPIFSSIVERCSDDHACFGAFAPHSTIVPNGTYYAFDTRTRDVREYAAELAVRYFVEHEAIVLERAPLKPAFKCNTPANASAWRAIADEFFAGVDLTSCAEEPKAGAGST
jgi:hypothetical protein